jgi:hypothetical protein
MGHSSMRRRRRGHDVRLLLGVGEPVVLRQSLCLMGYGGKGGLDREVVRLDQVILGAHEPGQEMTAAQKPH